ncbi:acetate--CoA ligase family protein [Urbifossiella limnaea]|uniref:acetate--CoA ligase family protein n=1 Tax=Urbifossiella limnaea TaxID=2528023 RepID=UPI0021BC7A39|nr:acetate--CoA ligase family protein [Urbifossiella limnaea]
MLPDFDDLDCAAARDACRRALAAHGAGWLSADDTRTVLSAVRLPLVPGHVARTADEAAEAAARFGFPVAVKLASRQLVHKTDVGGVRLGLADAEAVRLPARAAPAAAAAAPRARRPPRPSAGRRTGTATAAA